MMGRSWNPFLSLVFDNRPMGYAQRVTVYERVCTTPRLVSVLMRDNNMKDQLFVDFPTRVDRLVDFIRLVGPENTRVSKEIWLELVIPIVDESEEVDSDALIKLLVSAIPIIPSSVLERFATAIARPPTILERLVSAQVDNRVRDQIHSLAGAVRDLDMLDSWTKRIVTLCESCPNSHEVEGWIQRWKALAALKTALDNMEERFSQERGKFRSNDLPLLAGMRLLAEDDKKEGWARRSQGYGQPSFTFPPHAEDAIRAFGKIVPTSERQLQILIESLEKETREILMEVVGTYPCSSCYETAIRPTSTDPLQSKQQSLQLLENSSLSLHGKQLGVWKISLSSLALKGLNDLRLAGNDLFKRTEKALRDLGSGSWRGLSDEASSPHQRAHLKVPLLRAKITKQMHILWQIYVDFNEGTSNTEQLVRVWVIGNNSEVSRAIDRVGVLHKYYDQELVRQCTLKPQKDFEGRYTPFAFDKNSGATSSALVPAVRMDIRRTDKEVIEMANKFYSLTEPMIKSILSNNIEAEYPFDISEEEVKIIRHTGTSSLILGRSGTGKTTCLVYKLLSRYLARSEISGERRLRQVLLTRSPFLSSKLRTYTRKLIEAQTCKELPPDGSQKPDEALLETEDDISIDTISTLRDELFPLVCTYDQLLRALENTVRAADRKDFSYMIDRRHSSLSSLPPTGRKPQTVDFYTFKVDYWPQLPTTRSLPKELVFAEIMGIIKGSTSARDFLEPLSRTEYLSKGRRQAPIFTLESDRSRVYDLYEAYEGIKRRYGDVDYIDRVVRLLKAIRENEALRDRFMTAFDEIYVDEVQDQRTLDIELLLNIVRDARGFHLAGDTAQSISKDATFRFADIKALFYNHFSPASETANQADLAKPRSFTLSRNYRSHQGILSLASLVMKMLSTGFPDTVDKLEPEIGQLSGPKPTFFVDFSAQILSTQKLGLVNLNERVADFGAEQVILVRNEEAKKALQAQIGDVALVLTILQSKGMEFDDVILFNFFMESPCPASLRILGSLAGMGGSVEFDALKHMVLCSELKHLYVAITRARIQLSFIESSESRAVTEIIRVFTEHDSEPFVDVVRPNDPHATEMVKSLRSGESIDPERWALRGAHFMSQKNYGDALFCYNKTGYEKGRKTAKAFLSEGKGRSCRAKGDQAGFEKHILTAIDLFRELKMPKNAAENLEVLGKFEEAGNLWLSENSPSLAAPLFFKARLFLEASSCYHTISDHTRAASVLRTGSHFNDLVTYLHSNRPHIIPSTFRTFSRLCSLLLRQGRVSPHLKAKVYDLLEDREIFFRELNMFEELEEFLRGRGRWGDVFNLYAERGLVGKALGVVVEEGLDEEVERGVLLEVVNYVRVGEIFVGKKSDGLVGVGDIKYPRNREFERAEEDWKIVDGIVRSLEDAEGWSSIQQMEKGLARQISVNLSRYLSKTLSISNFPFEIIREAITVVRDILAKNSECPAWSVVCLLTGVYRPFSSSPILLNWSPLRGLADNTSDVRQLAKSWILGNLSSTILALDDHLKEAWRRDWPYRCQQNLVKGYCWRLREGGCSLLHKVPTAEDCSKKIGDLLCITSLYGDFEITYRSYAMTEKFNEHYPRMRRYWLESLLQALTYLSSFEQHPPSIVEAQIRLARDEELATVASSLEGLLYHRLHREWETRKSLSALMEQIQLAQNLGVPRRFSRVLSGKLSYYSFGGGQNLQHASATLSYLRAVETARTSQDFDAHLRELLESFERTDVRELASFHAVTSVVEYLAAYLIFLTCPSGTFVVPQSWIDLHLHLVADQLERSHLSEAERNTYRQSLLLLLTKFCALVQNIAQASAWGTDQNRFSFNRQYASTFLDRRNAEVLAVILMNLGAVGFQPRGFEAAWRMVREFFQLKHPRLNHMTIPQLGEQLHHAFTPYAGKNSLVIVTLGDTSTSTPIGRSPILQTLEKLGVKTIPIDEAMPTSAQGQWKDTDEKTTDGNAAVTDNTVRYSEEDAKRVTHIQRLWRRTGPRLKTRRLWEENPLARTIDHLIALGSTASTRTLILQTRYILLTILLTPSLTLPTLSSDLTTYRTRAAKVIEDPSAPFEKMEAIDGLLEELTNVERKLEDTKKEMDEDGLRELVERGDLGGLRRLAGRVGRGARDVERGLKGVESGLRGLAL
ncbi:MAG: hypothetical protein M1839_003958 [Geoglossum umbratile]|nr:MAG: hypothetical protein M1839_003958 [Geoglossum umbratile]